MITYVVIPLVFIYSLSGLSYSQTDSSYNSPDATDLSTSIREEILLEELTSDEEETSMLQESLENLARNPFDLNKVTPEQLGTIPFLNSIIAKNIIEYKQEISVFKSKRALLKVEGMTPDLYEKIKPYLVVKQLTRDISIDETGYNSKASKLITKKNFRFRLRSRIVQDLQPKAGFINKKYEGSRMKLYNQLNSQYHNLNFQVESNITLEKDHGEKNLTDFISGFLELKNFKSIKTAVAGDYTLNFAQGISMWTNQSLSKGAESVNSLKKKGKGIDGYSSVNEVQFFRGSAARINLNKIDMILFYSDNYYDASIDSSSNEVLGFYNDGYHRTSSEIRRKNSVKEKLLGGRVAFHHGNMIIGATSWTSKFTKPVAMVSIKQLFNFSGTLANMTGIDYDFIFKNINAYGEWARSQSGSIAGLSSIQLTFFKFADILFSYRYFSKEFASIHSSAFGERGGDTRNEKGFYTGITLRPFKGMLINCYFDQFEFPYRTFLDQLSTRGNDFLINADWNISRGLSFNIKYKCENKEDTRIAKDEFDRYVKRIDVRNQTNLRAGFIYQIADKFRLRSRFEYVYIDYENFGSDNKGILFYSDLRIRPFKGMSLETRFIFFDTEDYDSRVYEFENDIAGVSSNPALYGKGRRWYIIMKYKPFSFLEIGGKYSETFIEGVKSIGSGNDKTEGDIKSRLSLGVEVEF